MEKLANSRIIGYDFSKKQRGKLIADITNQVLKNLGKDYKLPKGYRTEFIEFAPNSKVNAFGDKENKKLYFSFNLFSNPDSFANDLYTVTKEIKMMCDYKGKYDDVRHPVDKESETFVSTDDLTKMITAEKSGNTAKNIDNVEEDKQALVDKIKKEVEVFMLAKNFNSPKEKESRKFATDFMKTLLAGLSAEPSASEIESIIRQIEEFITKKEEEEEEKEKEYGQFISGVERDIMQTIKASQQRISDDINSFSGMNNMVVNYKNTYGYDPLKVSAQSLSITYNDKLARNLFNACVMMDSDKKKHLTTCIDLIKYTDFTPTQMQVHNLNQACKSYNATCENSSEKVHPKKELKNFFNIKTTKQTKSSAATYEQAQTM